MADNPPKLGSLVKPGEPQHPRDAIHIACIQAQAASDPSHEYLRGGTAVVVAGVDLPVPVRAARTDETPLGLVDPFLRARRIRTGDPESVFWVMLMPNTITSLRHEWVHPEVPDMERLMVTKAKMFIEAFAASIDKSYDDLMSAATIYLEGDSHVMDNTQAYERRSSTEWQQFWTQFDIIAKYEGRHESPGSRRYAPFSCAC